MSSLANLSTPHPAPPPMVAASSTLRLSGQKKKTSRWTRARTIRTETSKMRTRRKANRERWVGEGNPGHLQLLTRGLHLEEEEAEVVVEVEEKASSGHPTKIGGSSRKGTARSPMCHGVQSQTPSEGIPR